MDNYTQNGGEDKMQVLSVFLGEHTLGIPVEEIQDILNPLKMTSVPLANSYVKGICNLLGRILTTLDLKKLLQQNSEADENSMNVVAEDNGELYSLLVDRVGDVLTLDNSKIEPPPFTLEESLKAVTKGVFQLDDSIVIILNINHIIQNVSKEEAI